MLDNCSKLQATQQITTDFTCHVRFLPFSSSAALLAAPPGDRADVREGERDAVTATLEALAALLAELLMGTVSPEGVQTLMELSKEVDNTRCRSGQQHRWKTQWSSYMLQRWTAKMHHTLLMHAEVNSSTADLYTCCRGGRQKCTTHCSSMHTAEVGSTGRHHHPVQHMLPRWTLAAAKTNA